MTPSSFTCPRCGRTSYNPNDIAHRYCGHCHVFVADPERVRLVPGYWMHETSGVLRPAIEAYLRHEPMTAQHIAAMRAYLRQWIDAPDWLGTDVVIAELRAGIDALTSREAIDKWLDLALDQGIDPL